MPRVKIEQLADWGHIYSTTQSLETGQPKDFFTVGDDTWFRVTVLPEDDPFAAEIIRTFRR